MEGAARDGDRQAALALGWLLEERGDGSEPPNGSAGPLMPATNTPRRRSASCGPRTATRRAPRRSGWRAAEGGIALAAYNLGQLLEPRDAGEAAAWYRHAVSAGGDGADAAQERLAALGD